MITAHVDDFLFSGRKDDPIWQQVEQAIQKEFKWSDWEEDSFTQCGVDIECQPDGSYYLSQKNYVASRKRDKHALTDKLEKSQLRALLGGISWHAQQVAPHFSAGVSLLLSEVNQSTVDTLHRANQLLDAVKGMKDHKLKIHCVPVEKITMVAWADAGAQNRLMAAVPRA